MSTTTLPPTIPVFPGLPLLGNLLDFRSKRLELIMQVSQRCGDIGALHLGNRTVVVLNTPELIQAALVEHAADFEKTPNLRIYGRPLLGNGLLTSENEFHKRQRKLVAPPFQHRRIASYADVMVNYSEQLQQAWAEGATIDVDREMMRLTLWIVGKTLFDADVLGEAEELGKALTVAMHRFNSEMSTIVHIPYEWPTPANERVRKAVGRLDATIYHMIEQRRRSGEDRGDLLSMLLAARDEDDGSFMTDKQVRDEALTLLIAGHETTANALTWTWYLLSQNPDVEARMHAEIDRALGGKLSGFEDLADLPYTGGVFAESLRLYPPAWAIGRRARQDYSIGGYGIPARSILLMSPWVVHRDRRWWPEPERFDPHRWHPEEVAKRPKFAYFPFGGGARVCIGERFAWAEGVLVLATIAQRWKMRLVPGHPVTTRAVITLRPKHGMKMTLEPRGLD